MEAIADAQTSKALFWIGRDSRAMDAQAKRRDGPVSLDPRRMRYFVALFEEGSVSRAAERENIVQPALSAQLKRLEQDLSVQLFARSPQGLQPTQAGRRFYAICSRLLRDIRAGEQEMLDVGGGVAGSVRAGVMTSICHGVFGRTLTRYCTAYPNVAVSIVEGTSGVLADRVALGTLDFAVCNRPASHNGLKLRRVFTDRFFLVSGHARDFARDGLCDLSREPELKLVLPSTHNALRRMLDRSIKAGAIRVARTIEIDGLGATLQFVEASDWSTLVPRIAMAQELSGSRFALSAIAQPALASEIYEMHPPDRPLSAAAERLVDAIRDDLLAWATSLSAP